MDYRRIAGFKIVPTPSRDGFKPRNYLGEFTSTIVDTNADIYGQRQESEAHDEKMSGKGKARECLELKLLDFFHLTARSAIHDTPCDMINDKSVYYLLLLVAI